MAAKAVGIVKERSLVLAARNDHFEYIAHNPIILPEN